MSIYFLQIRFRKHPLLKPYTLNPKVINWRVPNRLLDASSSFLNWPKVDRLTGADLVFSPHFNILATAKAPRVITFHDLSFLHHPDFFSYRQRFWHWLQNFQKQAKRAAKIIAVSEFTKSDLVELLKIQPEKISVIHSGISEEFRRLEIKDQGLKINFPYFLYLGTLEPRKNVAAIIRAFNILKEGRQFQDYKLVLAGRPGWHYQEIFRAAAASPFQKDILFWGPVNNQERLLLYNKAKAFIYPSFFEGFGFPPLEAQACGTPVIVANRTSLPEILGESALYINPWRIDELAAAMKELTTNEMLRQQLITAGLANAKRFTWQKTAEQTLNEFRQFQK